MAHNRKDQQAILKKLGIDALNEMQLESHEAIRSQSEIVLLSPTGTGKTLAFLLPLLDKLDSKLRKVQVMILVPSRELAIQIEQVIREMGSGFKTNAVYGGRAGFKDKLDLKHPPAILIGTPGRIADHLRRGTIEVDHIHTLVLDEYDKSLEVGFEEEMKEIVAALINLEKKILTSATQKAGIPEFLNLRFPTRLNFLQTEETKLQLQVVNSPSSDKLKTLSQLIHHTGNGSGIVFCNFKDTIQVVSDYLQNQNIDHTCFYGGMEQMERERALIKFRNGTHRILVATDLAARGIDVPEMDFIIHYELPKKKDEFIHRNGRTARMQEEGIAYVIKWEREPLPSFIRGYEEIELTKSVKSESTDWETLYITGGRKDKISKGDIAGFFLKKGKLKKDELGVIELKQDCAFVSVPSSKTAHLIRTLNNGRLKKRKVRITKLD